VGYILSQASTPATAGQVKSRLYVSLLATVAAISGLLFGFDTAVINGVLLFLRRQFTLTDLATEIAASALLLGCLLGAAGASLIGDRMGRKPLLLISALLFALSTVVAALAGGVVVFSLGRLAGGLAIGLASVLTPVYIAEIAPAANRGLLISLNQLAIVLGILAAYLVNWKLAVLGNSSWRWMLGTAAVPSLLFFMGLLAIPESPRWLISHHQREKGRAILVRMFGPGSAESEVKAVEQAATQEEGSWGEVFSRENRKRLGVAVTLAVLCQITGINTVLYYGSILMSEHFKGQSLGGTLLANVIIGCTNLLGTVAAMALLDRWGRRAMLLMATAGMTVSLTLLVVSYSLGLPSSWMLASIVLYVGFFAFAMGPVPWIILSEIFPTKIRGRAAAIATSALWSGTLLVTFTFLSLLRVFGVVGTFGIYAVLSLASFVYIWRKVPETKGRTLEEIQNDWEKS
jgi:sugar porter (SP) family MFS transporter